MNYEEKEVDNLKRSLIRLIQGLLKDGTISDGQFRYFTELLEK